MADVRKGRINPVACTMHKDCIMPEARRRRKELIEFVKQRLPTLASLSRECRLADFIYDVGNSPQKPRFWWTECIADDLTTRRQQCKAARDRIQDAIDAKIDEYLLFIDDRVVPDLIKWHGQERDRISLFNEVLESIFNVPTSRSSKWFLDKVLPGMLPGRSNEITKVVPWGKILKGSWDTYRKTLVHLTPLLLSAAGRLPKTQVLDLVKHVVIPKSIYGSNAVKAGSDVFEVSFAGFGAPKGGWWSEKKGGVEIKGEMRLTGKTTFRMVQFTTLKHLYRFPVVTGLFGAVAIVLTLRDTANDPSVKNFLKSAAGLCSLNNSVMDVLAVRALRARDIVTRLEMEALKKDPEVVAGVSFASKAFARTGYLLGAVVGAIDAADFFTSGDTNAGVFSSIGALGCLLLIIPGLGWVGAGAGILLTLVGAIGAAMSADEELVRWAKRSPFGRSATDTAEQSEKALGVVLAKVRQHAADQLDADARELRRINDRMLQRLQRGLSPWRDAPKTKLDEDDARAASARNERLANSKVLEAMALRQAWVSA